MKIKLFSTCPQSSAVDREKYLQNVADVSRWSERYGCHGILVYTDNSLVDPWLVSQVIVQSTKTLSPLVAIQPVYMHPYSVAKMVASLGHFYGRQISLNMVAGGFKNDLAALNDTTPHDKRYERLIEYSTIIKKLLTTTHGVTCDGEFYKVENLKLTPSLHPSLFPEILVSGSSEAGLAAARAIGATAVHYPKPARDYTGASVKDASGAGIRVGIITRETSSEAWRIAQERFPEDRKGQITHQLAMKVSDSLWHRQLSQVKTEAEKDAYWLTPFQNYKTFCPYLVGSYELIAEELAVYISAGYETFILDIPPNEEELHHTSVVFRRALEQVT